MGSNSYYDHLQTKKLDYNIRLELYFAFVYVCNVGVRIDCYCYKVNTAPALEKNQINKGGEYSTNPRALHIRS